MPDDGTVPGLWTNREPSLAMVETIQDSPRLVVSSPSIWLDEKGRTRCRVPLPPFSVPYHDSEFFIIESNERISSSLIVIESTFKVGNSFAVSLLPCPPLVPSVGDRINVLVVTAAFARLPSSPGTRREAAIPLIASTPYLDTQESNRMAPKAMILDVNRIISMTDFLEL